ncbi:Glycosyl hydrolases family 25 protein [Trichomonas vaginalis G3]|uniref:N,O-diacetylmuramidase n=1 Tax=Trichomonas vaginalis (strain ATCC PRA-98 / G3) TaxID=412133 RepID=A2EB09_TRIV3|nr:glycosyl hydrolase [Trichomonas vaginalis G3]EAY10149.1 Glycosyl hydrolases family 25 protein [Trichomonas vaginalis G3]KAI5534476.1 gh25 lytc-like domain-containing protein [Trichomonas vaginalis G3]|eukprot:XP_001322372.1 glycosyl hydrolase [Trichomonas vaginalis G3]
MPYKVIDISVWQGDIDFNAARDQSGVQGVMIRCGYGSYSPAQIDGQFHNHMRAAIAANMLIGVYHYGYAQSVPEAEGEADFAISIFDQYRQWIRLPIAYDIEDPTMNVGRDLVGQMAAAFANKIRAAGYTPMCYCNLNWATNFINMDIVNANGIDVWIAQYNSECQYWGPYVMWQFTDCLPIGGYYAGVDGSWCYKDY